MLPSVFFQLNTYSQVSILSTEEFEKGINLENIQLLDVRTLGEYNSGHIKNALLADWTQREVFEERIKSLDKSAPVYTYCLSGSRSSAAGAWLKQAGFREVNNLKGGILAWKAASKPLESVEKTRQLTIKEFRDKLAGDQPVLVDIGAVWCPPCKKMEPVIKELLESKNPSFKLLKIDGGVQEALVQALNINAFPAFIIYKKGKEVWRKEGLVTKEELRKLLNSTKK